MLRILSFFALSLALVTTFTISSRRARQISSVNSTQNSQELDEARFARDWAAWPFDLQNEVRIAIDKMVKSDKAFVDVSTAIAVQGPLYVFVPGIDYEKNLLMWRMPIGSLIQKNRNIYLFKWSKRESLQTNAQNLFDELTKLQAKFPQQKINVIAHSAGGIMALMTLDMMTDKTPPKDLDQFYFYTAATPLFGYSQPSQFAGFVGALIGESTRQIGVGAYPLLNHKKLTHCTHWVDTDCRLDMHTCPRAGVSPETGPTDRPYTLLPCAGDGTLVKVESTHAGILSDFMQSLLPL